MLRRYRLLLFATALLLGTLSAAPRTEDEAAWNGRLLEIAGKYEEWGRVDRVMRWSPARCALNGPTPKIELRHTLADDGTPHGRKLYSVYAKHTWVPQGLAGGFRTYLPDLYPRLRLPKEEAGTPPGQVLVKEAFMPVAISAAEYAELKRQAGTSKAKAIALPKDEYHGFVDCESEFRSIAIWKKDGQESHYRAGDFAGLFIMFKVDPATSGTDAGWVYGTVDATKKKVTGVGKIASCMECHQQAKHDRLFGLPEK